MTSESYLREEVVTIKGSEWGWAPLCASPPPPASPLLNLFLIPFITLGEVPQIKDLNHLVINMKILRVFKWLVFHSLV